MRYSVTVMSEPMTLFFITAFYYYWLAFTESRKHKYFLALIFFGCTAINTRYPSLVIILIPLLHALYLFIRNFRVGFFLSSCLIAGLVILPAFLLRVYEPGSIFSQPDFAHWSMGNYIKRSFITADGEHSYLLPNICYVFTDLVHPGYIFPGLVFLFFFIKHRMERAFMKVILFVVLVYAFFLAGLSFQNDRVLILTFPLVLILFARPFLALKEKIGKLIHPNPSLGFQESSLFISRRGSQINRRVMQKIENVCLYFARLCVKLCETLRKTFIFHFFGQHFKKLVIISLILIQIVLFYRAFNPIYRNNRITKTISEEMLKYPGKKIYTFNIDMALKGYGVKNEMVSLWSNKIDVFEPNALVLFNFADSRKQWKGMNPMINWETLSRDHHLKLLENFPEGWNLYEITD
jgi:4-amino-4-deoxy-L-arabinose transferase-like glycosyltransferase